MEAPPRRLAEWLFASLVLLGLAITIGRFWRDGYLPQPFYYRVSDTLMDLHGPALWANTGGAYHVWHALYPPLSFVYLKLTSLGACYASNEWAGRDCDWLAKAVLLAVFAGNIALIWVTYRIADARTATPRAIAMALGVPMLYALERGNLLIPCFTCFALGYGDVFRRRWPRWIALALSFNFKPYLGLVALPFLVQRRWSWVMACLAFGVAIYLATLAIYGSGSPMEIIVNETRYSVAVSKGYFSDLYFATAYWPLIRLLHALPPELRLIPDGLAQALALGLTLALRASQAAALICLALAAWRPERTDVRRLAALVAAVAITAFTTGSAGYSQIFLVFLVFFEPWTGRLRPVMLTATYILCLPLDIVLVPLIHQPAHSYLGGRTVMTDFGLSLGQLLRPGLLLVIQGALVTLNLRDIFRPAAKPRPADGPSPL